MSLGRSEGGGDRTTSRGMDREMDRGIGWAREGAGERFSGSSGMMPHILLYVDAVGLKVFMSTCGRRLASVWSLDSKPIARHRI